MGIGEGLNLSTFGAVGDESKVGTLYSTDEWSVFYRQFGWQRGSFRPIGLGQKDFILYIKLFMQRQSDKSIEFLCMNKYKPVHMRLPVSKYTK